MFESVVTTPVETGHPRSRPMRRNPIGFRFTGMTAGMFVSFAMPLISAFATPADAAMRSPTMDGSLGPASIPVVVAGADARIGPIKRARPHAAE